MPAHTPPMEVCAGIVALQRIFPFQFIIISYDTDIVVASVFRYKLQLFSDKCKDIYLMLQIYGIENLTILTIDN